MSRRPCIENECTYCAKAETKYVPEQLTQKCSVVETRNSSPKMSSEPDKGQVQTIDFDIGKMQCEDPDLKMFLNGCKKGLNPIGETFPI